MRQHIHCIQNALTNGNLKKQTRKPKAGERRQNDEFSSGVSLREIQALHTHYLLQINFPKS
jgi:hypothetical protein